MPNLTEFNPNKNTQVISSQVLVEYFSSHDGPLELEKTSQGFLLNIPQSFFIKQSNEQKAIDEWAKQAFGAVKISAENSPKGSLEDFNVADHIQLFDNMGE